jgi:hypothetical protein
MHPGVVQVAVPGTYPRHTGGGIIGGKTVYTVTFIIPLMAVIILPIA